jgi:uncharacterized protein (DUF1330 family)
MPKGYWLTFYRSLPSAALLTAYGKLAVPAIQAGGGRFLARGTPARTYEAGVQQRVTVIEFDSLAQAVATYEGADYQAAVRVLEGAVERDIRFMEGAT